MRYFYVAFSFSTGSAYGTQSFGIDCNGFPSMESLKEKLKSISPEAKDIVVLSVCEFAKEDYDIFFEINQPAK